MAILHLEELEAYIKWIYSKFPETKYSSRKLTKKLRELNVENAQEDITLLHGDLYIKDLNVVSSDDIDSSYGYSMNDDEPFMHNAVEVEEDADDDYPFKHKPLEVSADNTAMLAKLYGDGLDDFYNDERFR